MKPRQISLGQHRQIWKQKLQQFNLVPLSVDCNRIFCDVLEISEIDLLTRPDMSLGDDQVRAVDELMERRLLGEPLDYILGYTEFLGRTLHVSSDVLIPRPETEELVTRIVSSYPSGVPRALDLGTGSGCIPISLSLAWQDSYIEAWDVCENALKMAQINQSKLGSNVQFFQKDFCQSHQWEAAEPFDIIVSNPPYIPSQDVLALDPMVKDFEPHLALDGGASGTQAYEAICRFAPKVLTPSGRVFLEIGYDQGESVPRLFEETGWQNIEVVADSFGKDRFVFASVDG